MLGWKSFILLMIGFVYIPLFGEIQHVIITWTPMECQAKCLEGLNTQFAKIQGVSEVSINQSAGQVTLKWKPNIPFSFSPVNIAMEMIGLTINDIRISVHGTLRHDPTHVSLTSIGDNTRFDLLNPVTPETSRQAAQFNIGARGLKPELRQKLLEGESNHQEATIEGPLFMPERSPPLELVVDKLQFSKPTDKPAPKR